jgi:hypothetical protein
MEQSWLYLHEKEQISAFNILLICKNYQFLKNQEISILSIFRSKNVILDPTLCEILILLEFIFFS